MLHFETDVYWSNDYRTAIHVRNVYGQDGRELWEERNGTGPNQRILTYLGYWDNVQEAHKEARTRTDWRA